MFLNNRKNLLELRKKLRNNSTPAEIALWDLIKNSKLGKKFRRQHSVANYILDFYCPEEKLAIELDGAYHDAEYPRLYDKARTEFLNSLNIRVLRFENKMVFRNPDQLILEIKKNFKC
jgi:very-short-patch-repair endonuclease